MRAKDKNMRVHSESDQDGPSFNFCEAVRKDFVVNFRLFVAAKTESRFYSKDKTIIIQVQIDKRTRGELVLQ